MRIRSRSVSEGVLSSAVEATSAGVIITDGEQNIIYVNQAFQDSTGYQSDEVIGRNCRLLQGVDSDVREVRRIREALAARQRFGGEILNYRKDGTAFWNELLITPLFDADENVSHFISIQRDISEVVQLRDALRVEVEQHKREAETARLLLDVAHSLSDYKALNEVTELIVDSVVRVCAADRSALALWDAEHEQLTISAFSGWPETLATKLAAFTTRPRDLPELAELVATGQRVLVGVNPSDAMRVILAEYEIEGFVAVPVATGALLHGILLAYWEHRIPEVHGNPTIDGRLDGLADLAAIALRNAALVDNALWLGQHDPLTGLFNRTVFDDALVRELARSSNPEELAAVVYLDVNELKHINDTLGHRVGDAVLRHVADVIRDATRSSDIVARIGGDEFVVLLTNMPNAAVPDRVLHRIERRLREPLRVDGSDVLTVVSAGVSFLDHAGSSADPATRAIAILAEADRSMYANKARRIASEGGASRRSEVTQRR